MNDFNVKIRVIDTKSVSVHCIHLGRKVGVSFSFENYEDYCTKFGEACAAILRRINKIPIKAEELKPEPPPVDRTKVCTTDAKPFDPTTDSSGQQKNYKVLCEEERSKGFVRPYRDRYVHVGVGGSEIDPNNPSKHGRKGNGCGVETRMGRALSETYARDPKFYTHTYCAGCKTHLPVDEFVWDDGEVVGS